MKSIFDPTGAEELVTRVEQLTPDTEPAWGTMTVDQMLAHCCRPFDTIFDPAYAEKHPKPNPLVRGLLRLFIKPILVGPKPYKHNMRTAPEFIIADRREFASEQSRLIEYVNRVHAAGEDEFEGKVSHSFGPLTAGEWSMLLYKHTDHHLAQFGV